MVKTYLKYELRDTYGMISSSNAVLDCHGRSPVAVTGTLDSVSAWDLSRSERLWQVRDAEDTKSEVLCVAQPRVSSDATRTTVATGHSDGTIRLWPRNLKTRKPIRHTYNDTESGGFLGSETAEEEADLGTVVTLAGHRNGVISLAFDEDGTMLASGSKDTDIVVWDVANERGLFRLRGHTAPVTAVAWLQQTRPEPRTLLLSGSRDGLVKVWDVTSQQCIQTVVGHRAEVLSVAVDPNTYTAYTGAADGKLRVWNILSDKEAKEAAAASAASGMDTVGDLSPILQLSGELIPPFGTRGDGLAGARRVNNLVISKDGRVLACIVGERVVAVYKIATEEEVAKKRRRKMKRAALKKQRKQQKQESKHEEEDEGEEDEEKEQEEDIEEKYQYQWPLRSPSGKIRSVDISDDGKTALLAMANNTLELYTLHVGETTSQEEGSEEEIKHFELIRSIEQQGHRTDIRAAVLTADDQTLVTVSNGSTKVWSVRGGRCLRSVECTYGLCAAVLPGGRHAVIGTKEGTLQLVDIAAGVILEEVEAHTGAVWSVCTRPGGSGIVTGGADKLVKFWSFGTRVLGSGKDKKKSEKGGKVLTLIEDNSSEMDDDVLCVKMSPDGKLLAVALLDSIVKVYKVSDEGEGEDLKYFLSLYGHKLPVLSLDISDDSHLLVSGSADKNVKIWGLDFGDCHRSLFAHNDSVTQVAFVPRTHYFFSVGKDGALKYWDADNFEQIQSLSGQRGVGSPCWCVAVGGAGQLVVTAGHDRSIRVWERTHEQLFLEEEKERRLDEQFEAAIEEQEDFAARNDPSRPESQAADRKTLATVRSGEVLLEALDMAEEESAKFAMYERELERSKRESKKKEDDNVRAMKAAVGLSGDDMGDEMTDDQLRPPAKNPLMLGLAPADYVLDRLTRIPAGHLEQSLLLLPFHHVCAFLKYADELISRGLRIELLSKCVFFLLRTHHAQLTAAASTDLGPVVASLKTNITAALTAERDRIGFNLAALSYMKRELDAEAEAHLYNTETLSLQLSQIKIAQRQKQMKAGLLKKKKKGQNPPVIPII